MLGVTPEERHIHFKMTVADFDEKCVLVVGYGDAFLVF
jgi:hypothetical protein